MEQSVRVPSVTEQRILEGLKNITEPDRLPGGLDGAAASVLLYCDGQLDHLPAAGAISEYGTMCDDVCKLISSSAATEPLRVLLKMGETVRLDDRMIRWLHDADAASSSATRYADILAMSSCHGEWERWCWSQRYFDCRDFADLISECRIICDNQVSAASSEPVKTTSTTPGMDDYFSPEMVSRIKSVVEVEKISGAAEFASLYIAITQSSSDGIIKTGCPYAWFAKHFAPSINSKTFTKLVHEQEGDWSQDTKPYYSGNPSKSSKRIRRYLNALDGS